MTENPYLKRAAKRGSTGHGNLSEKRVAKKIGATPTAASGARASDKGDMKIQYGDWKFRIESKATLDNTMKVEMGWLVKISHEAFATGCKPALTVSFVTPEGKLRTEDDWIAIRRRDFEDLIEAVKGEAV